MEDKVCIPYAPLLIESIRSIGYSFSSAISDLLDNSISAEATRIDIMSAPGDNPSIAIIDDGCGMNDETLYEAMRYGSLGPLKERKEKDLGRFGLGLKSASLSQCRKLTVVSKQGDSICAYAWDLDYVIAKNNWMVKQFSDYEIDDFPYIDRLKSLEHGTYVLLQDFDRLKTGSHSIEDTMSNCLSDMREHISLVFHRFIKPDDESERALRIYINDSVVMARDPFLLSNRATQRKAEQVISVRDDKSRVMGSIVIKAFILPHMSKLTHVDEKNLGGKENLFSGQGFYIYRNKRLIIWGTWFRLARKEEFNKYARVRVDIPNTLDYMWGIDIKKSSAKLPDSLKEDLLKSVRQSILPSSDIVKPIKHRELSGDKNLKYVWEMIGRESEGHQFVISRELPQIELLNQSLDKNESKLLNNLLCTIENSLPVDVLYNMVADGRINDRATFTEIEKVKADLLVQLDYVKSNGLSLKKYCELFMKTEPYCKYDEVKKIIEEEMKND